MAFRLHGFAEMDPLEVPLPNGTEVSTRVDREHAGKTVPQGALGRVVGAEGEHYRVRMVGAGEVVYHRHELLPRKQGQLRYARARAVAWETLSPTIVLEAVVGSQAWGLAAEESDVDRRGVFVLPFAWIASLRDPPLDLASRDGSATYWEVGKAIRQGILADPNTMEMLFVDRITARDPIGEWILEEREAFVSAEIYGSFGRYALSQLAKLEHSQVLADHRTIVLRWLEEAPELRLDEVAERLARETETPAPDPHAARQRAKQYVKSLYRSMFAQGLLDSREFEALKRYAAATPPELDLPRPLRPKNAYNLLRLLWTAIIWLEAGEARLRMEDPLKSRLLAIKAGAVPLAEVLKQAEELLPRLEAARRDTPLPPRADLERADRLYRRIRHEAARRSLGGLPGALGRDAPEPPLARWDDEAGEEEPPEAGGGEE